MVKTTVGEFYVQNVFQPQKKRNEQKVYDQYDTFRELFELHFTSDLKRKYLEINKTGIPPYLKF